MLAVPAMVWVGAAYEELFVECGLGTGCEEGDRRRGWFLGVLVTAPLIPVGARLVGGAPGRGSALTALLRLVCVLAAGFFGLLGLLALAASTGLTEAGSDATPGYVPVGLFCLAIGAWLLLVRRRLTRRYP